MQRSPAHWCAGTSRCPRPGRRPRIGVSDGPGIDVTPQREGDLAGPRGVTAPFNAVATPGRRNVDVATERRGVCWQRRAQGCGERRTCRESEARHPPPQSCWLLAMATFRKLRTVRPCPLMHRGSSRSKRPFRSVGYPGKASIRSPSEENHDCPTLREPLSCFQPVNSQFLAQGKAWDRSAPMCEARKAWPHK